MPDSHLPIPPGIQIKHGIVKKIEAEKIQVELAPIIQKECESSCHCKGLVLEDKPSGILVWIPVAKDHHFQLEEAIFVQANLPSAYIGMLFIFIIPVIFLVIGAWLGKSLSTAYSLSSPNFWIAGFAILGFCIALGIAILFDIYYRRFHSAFRVWDGKKEDWQGLLKASSPCAGCTSGTCSLSSQYRK